MTAAGRPLTDLSVAPDRPLSTISVRDLLPPAVYAAQRPMQKRAMQLHRDRRRLVLGPHCSILFEDRQSVLFQIQEVLHVEAGPRATAERVQREIENYAPITAGRGEVCASLFVQPLDRATGDDICGGLASGRLAVALRIGRRHCLAECHPDVDPLDPVKYLRFTLPENTRHHLAQGPAPAVLLLGPRLTVVQPIRSPELLLDLAPR